MRTRCITLDRVTGFRMIEAAGKNLIKILQPTRMATQTTRNKSEANPVMS